MPVLVTMFAAGICTGFLMARTIYRTPLQPRLVADSYCSECDYPLPADGSACRCKTITRRQ